MQAKKMLVLIVVFLFSIILLHLGLSAAMEVRREIRAIGMSLDMASETMRQRLTDLTDTASLMLEQSLSGGAVLPAGVEVETVGKGGAPGERYPFLEPDEYRDSWRPLPSGSAKPTLFLGRTFLLNDSVFFVTVEADISWLGKTRISDWGSSMAITDGAGAELWSSSGFRDAGTAGGNAADALEIKAQDHDKRQWARKATVLPGELFLEVRFPYDVMGMFLFSRLSGSLLIEGAMVLSLVVMWLVFSRYLISPLERVTRLSVQMQDRLFSSVTSEALTETVSGAARGIRELISSTRLVEVRSFCQTLSSALQSYVLQQEKLVASSRTLETVNQSLSEANANLLQRDRIWRNLLEISRNIASGAGRQNGLDRIADILRDISDSSGVIILRVESGNLLVVASSGIDTPMKYHEIDLESSLLGKAVEEQKPVWCEDVLSEPLHVPVHSKVVSELIVPMFYMGQSVGGIVVEWGNRVSENPALLEMVMPIASHVGGMLNARKSLEDLKYSYQYMAARLQNLTAIYHDETAEHLERVEHYCRFLSAAFNKNKEDIEEVALFSRLHDIGKLRVPMEILTKPGPLTEQEFEEVKKHTLWGADILGDASWLLKARNICLYHHEKWDGSGYPFGLKGEDIPWEARVVALADTYDALRSSRAYKPPFPHFRAVQIILKGDDRVEPSHFDPVLLQTFRKLHHRMEEIYESLRERSRC